MSEIRTSVLLGIVRDRERMGEHTISAEALLASLQLPPIVDAKELSRLRNIEKLARKIVASPLWELRGAEPGEAEALRRLVLEDSAG